MRVFLTGATGFIGSAIIPELLAAGHEVLGLTRSDSGAEQLRAAGADVHRGSLEEPETLRAGAEHADGVIHCAFDHNFANFVANCEKDVRNIEALGAALKGSNRPLVVTSGTAMGSTAPGQVATEDVFNADYPHPRKLSELTANALLEAGVNVSVVRLPQVHDPLKQGFITVLVPILKEKGVSAYIGEGGNRWPAAHVTDVARLYRLALERAQPGARYNAVAEEGVTVRDIAEVLGRGLGIPTRSVAPEQATEYLGWLASFASLDMPASNTLTRQALHWEPTGPTLLEDLEQMRFLELLG